MLEPGAFHNAVVEACARNRDSVDFKKYCDALKAIAEQIDKTPIKYLGIFDAFCALIDAIGKSHDSSLGPREKGEKALLASIAHLGLDVNDSKIRPIIEIISPTSKDHTSEVGLAGVSSRFSSSVLTFDDETRDAILSIALSSRYLTEELYRGRSMSTARGVLETDVGGGMIGGLIGGPQGAIAVGVGMSVLALL